MDVKNIIKKSINYMGYDINKIAKKRNLKDFKCLTDYSNVIYSTKENFFLVDVDISCNQIGFMFGKEEWHPFTKAVQEIIKRENVIYKDSILKKFYDSYQPASLYELFFSKMANGLDSYEVDYLKSISKLSLTLPWFYEKKEIVSGEKGLCSSHGWQGCGPVSDEKGLLELNRLKVVYNSISKKGYKSKHSDEINGYFLKNEDVYRFIVLGGNHRVPVLSAMGYEYIPVKFRSNYPRVIDIKNVKEWPHVKSGEMSENIAREIFMTFFNSEKKKLVQQLGIVEAICYEGK
ncbi:hypothetical protein [Isachenkonia alkalipeptolytica]|uniref:Uncharacterized protein n=1 Tax=Isachenkonia alkalipeptolytica TaxID=2565777 RepID=A0AA43XN85_9CLOT|nr:hypothetical protein [Isachenkonia alkalipeptolytica]NBG89526.1 hypothetical protein [Isachenkonia alkalipeptolytica]